jgi:hypothetical protein
MIKALQESRDFARREHLTVLREEGLAAALNSFAERCPSCAFCGRPREAVAGST